MDQLQFEKLIAIAIKREVESHEFYRDVAARTEDPYIKQIFKDLAAQEMGHRDLLERYRFDSTLAIKFQAPKDLKIAETVDEPRLSVNMKPVDAIALAMKKEQHALEFYRQLAALCDDEEVKKNYLNLANMEMEHKVRLENTFVDIGYPESF